MLTPSLRKFALTSHVVTSVGWLGAVVAFLSLVVVGLTSTDASVVRAAYISSKTITWAVIVPLSLITLVIGLVQALGTQWGLFRHWWVVAKLAIAVFATLLLLLHTQPIDRVARTAVERGIAGNDLRNLRIQLVFDAAAAVVALLVATVLSIYKPGGTLAATRRRSLILILLGIVIVLFVVRHLSRGAFGH